MREYDYSMSNQYYYSNPTTITGPSGTTTIHYDVAGVPTSVTTNGVTVYRSDTAATNYAVPSQMTVGSLTQTMNYNLFLGLTNETVPNNSTVLVSYDASARPTSVTSPYDLTNNTKTLTTYNDAATPPTQTTSINGRWTRTTLDGLGRAVLTETGDGSGTKSQAETVYGSCGCSPLGKMTQQAVPHAPGATTAYTTYTYDGVGRTLSVRAPDGASTTTYLYQGNTVTVTDPAGKWKKYTTDALGRLVQVNEPNPAGGADYATTYAYDLLGHVTSVSMPRPTGTQTRSFTYSGNLLMSATNPENGMVSSTYNSYNEVATRIDAKGQKAVYSYDSYARLTKVQRYPNGSTEDTCQQENYSYDSNPYDGAYSQNVAGRLAAVQYYGGPGCNTTFTEMYNYHPAGARVGKRLRVSRAGLASLDLNETAAYDTEGRMIGDQYPSGPNLTMAYDSMGRLYSLADSSGTVIGNASYGPAGQLLNLSGGSWGTETRTYNAMLQLTQLSLPGWNVQYNYSATQNNGKIVSQTDVLSGEQVTYAYDSLNRLLSASSSQSWSQTFGYDGFGNLGTVTGVNAPGLGVTYNPATNQQTTDCADANGNVFGLVSCAGANAYTYDVENRLTAPASAGGMRYSYAPGNQRVWRGNGGSTDEVTYWGVSGQKLGTYQLSVSGSALACTLTGANYYFGSKLVKNAGGFVYADRLGSTVKTYPYGVERPSATGNGKEKFAGYFRDAETGLDYAVNRYEQPGMGRFLTPDPLTASATTTDSGSWNRYAYVGGDPVNRADPSGLVATCPSGTHVNSSGNGCDPDWWVPTGGSSGWAPDPNFYMAIFNCIFFHTGCPSGYPTPAPTVTQQATTPGSGGISAARAATLRFVGIQFSKACDDFLTNTTGLSVGDVQAKAADADIVDGTAVTTAWGSTLFPGDPANAAGNQARADAATGIMGTTMAQYLAVSPNIHAAGQYNGNTIFVNSTFTSGQALGVYTIFHETLHLLGYGDQRLESLLGISDQLVRLMGSESITYRLMGGCGGP